MAIVLVSGVIWEAFDSSGMIGARIFFSLMFSVGDNG